MAYTERYVTSGAGGGGSGTSGSPWTLAEAFTNAVAGDRVNIKSDAAYSRGASTIPAGTALLPIIFRGYHTSIGDLDNQGRLSTGLLDTTNFPEITITGLWTPNNHVVLRSLLITGALSGPLIGNTVVDAWAVVRLKITNTQNNAAARCLQFDDRCTIVDSDFYCTGASHAGLVDADENFTAIACRFTPTAGAACLELNSGAAVGNVFDGGGIASTTGIKFNNVTNNSANQHVINNTLYALGTAIEIPNTTPGGLAPFVVNNHVTDCSEYLDSLHSATNDIPVHEISNRTRDNTTPRNGILNSEMSEITTDTGGASTDYANAGGDDFFLISGAPGRATGLLPNQDIGALQHADPPGGGGLGNRIISANGGLIIAGHG
jgi:hypothetical protein